MASIHKDIIIDAHPRSRLGRAARFRRAAYAAGAGLRDRHQLDGDARIVTFSNGTVAREILVDCDDDEAAAGLRHRQRTHQAAQRLGAGVCRKRRAHPLRVDRRRAAERDRALYGRADGSRPARDAEGAGTQRRMIIAFLDAARRGRPLGRPRRQDGSLRPLRRLLGSRRQAIFRQTARERRRAGEWHFGWALEGRAIQDVWIVPPRGELRHGDAAANVNSYGTTLRVYDPDIDAWRIQWTDPVTRKFPADDRPRGRRATSCNWARGRTANWRAGAFRDITAEFVPLARRSLRGPWRNWRSITEFTARRRASVIFLTDRPPPSPSLTRVRPNGAALRGARAHEELNHDWS